MPFSPSRRGVLYPLMLNVLCVLLNACGDGSSPPTAPPTAPPVSTNDAPSIIAQPVAQSVTAPTAAGFNVTVSGTPSPTYQWQLSTDGTTFSNISGATSAAYDTGATTTSQSGRSYRVIVTNSVGSVTSNPAGLTVNAASTLPVISAQPAAQTVTEPAQATFSVTASGDPSPTYQWQLSTDHGTYVDIGGATDSSYTTAATQTGQSGYQYRVVVSNSAGSVNSDGAQLSVNATASGATIIFSLNNGTVNVENGDLYAIPESGGTPVELATSADSEGFCGVTPSGRVIYQRNTSANGVDIYSVKTDGTDTRALATSPDNETCVKIIPSGPAAGRLIYRRITANGGRDIYAVNDDGTHATPLANGPLNEECYGITDDYHVIFQTDPFQDSNLYSVDLEGLSVIPLATSANYETFQGIVGNTVIFSVSNGYQGDLHTIDALGGSLSMLATNPAANEDLAGISPTGALLINVQESSSQNRDLYAGGIALAATSDFEAYAGSSAGGRVVYTVWPGNGNSNDLYSVRIDGSARVALATTPDNEGLAYITADEKAIFNREAITGATPTLGDLYLINLDGSNLVPLATSIHHETFTALIGNKVLYQRQTVNSFNDIQLWSVNLDGSGAMRLFTGGGTTYFAATTPGGRVLVNNYTGVSNLYIVNIDGSGQRLLASRASFHAVVP